jgi:hypothetical protein
MQGVNPIFMGLCREGYAARMYKPTPKEAALLLILLLNGRGFGMGGKPARVSELTLRRLWKRQRLTEQFLQEVEEWLLSAGWALVFAGSTFGAVRVDAVENWHRLSSKRLDDEIDKVGRGDFNFGDLERRFLAADGDQTDADSDE